MLEEFEEKILIYADTIYKGRKIITFIYEMRQGFTHLATSYLTLGCLNDNRTSLIRMFTSVEWKATKFARKHDGRLIENVVLDKEFWKSITFIFKGAFPLTNILHLVDSNEYEKPLMGLIYEAMDQAKENIQSAYNGLEDE
ncbi:hypothetical protein Lal_00030125 [Lupinus albus]|nr:hypothetical protein Lal_00030125 [Lupinus albus]